MFHCCAFSDLDYSLVFTIEGSTLATVDEYMSCLVGWLSVSSPRDFSWLDQSYGFGRVHRGEVSE